MSQNARPAGRLRVPLNAGSGSALRPYDGASMVYDANVADRVRDLLACERDLTERKMFGGLAFLVAGNMAVAASGQGGILV